MSQFLDTYASLFDHVLVACMLAMSQYVLLRAGVFSLGPAAFAAFGAYTTAILSTRFGTAPPLAIAAGVVVSVAISILLALPLARLRGVYQAVATLALVQIVLTIAQNWVSLTGGASGIDRIPPVATTGVLAACVILTVLLLVAMGRFGIGRTLDVIREDETVAVSLGVAVPRYHGLAFVLSGAIAGLAGGLQACSNYTITPGDFGFTLMVAVLAMVVLGGRTSVWGALVGAAILTTLPEIFRPFADYRNVLQGGLLVAVITYLPRGVADTLIAQWQDRRLRQGISNRAASSHGKGALGDSRVKA